MHKNIHLAVLAAAAFPAASFAQDVARGQYVGTASGFVVASEETERGSIEPGENATAAFTGSNALNVFNTQTSPGNFAVASSSGGINKVLADSRGTSDVVYAGSYWGDLLTITGGVGPVRIELEWDIDFVINDSFGDYTFNSDNGPVVGGTDQGNTALRYRTLVNNQGNTNLSPTNEGPDFFLRLATDPNYANGLVVPEFDPNDAGNFDLAFDDQFGFDRDGQDSIVGPLTTGNRDDLDFTVNGFVTTWQYGQPLAIGQLLEAWATGGAVVDAFNTGVFGTITLPEAASVQSAGGYTYTVNNVPEPTAGVVLLTALGGLATRRRGRTG